MNRLIYPTDNKVLRFIGDVLITFGSYITSIGLKWGGLYEFEVDFDDEEEDEEYV